MAKVLFEVKDIGNQPPNPWFISFWKGLQLPFPNERHLILQFCKTTNQTEQITIGYMNGFSINYIIFCFAKFLKILFITCAKKIINYCKIKYLQSF
jgi:hypothetical protein